MRWKQAVYAALKREIDEVILFSWGKKHGQRDHRAEGDGRLEEGIRFSGFSEGEPFDG